MLSNTDGGVAELEYAAVLETVGHYDHVGSTPTVATYV